MCCAETGRRPPSVRRRRRDLPPLATEGVLPSCDQFACTNACDASPRQKAGTGCADQRLARLVEATLERSLPRIAAAVRCHPAPMDGSGRSRPGAAVSRSASTKTDSRAGLSGGAPVGRCPGALQVLDDDAPVRFGSSIRRARPGMRMRSAMPASARRRLPYASAIVADRVAVAEVPDRSSAARDDPGHEQSVACDHRQTCRRVGEADVPRSAIGPVAQGGELEVPACVLIVWRCLTPSDRADAVARHRCARSDCASRVPPVEHENGGDGDRHHRLDQREARAPPPDSRCAASLRKHNVASCLCNHAAGRANSSPCQITGRV